MTVSTPPLPQPNQPPSYANASVALAGQRERRRSMGAGSTIMTSGQGTTFSAPLATKTLLGQ